MRKRKIIQSTLFGVFLILGIGAFIYVHFVLMGGSDLPLHSYTQVLTEEPRSSLSDLNVIIEFGEALRDLFIQPE